MDFLDFGLRLEEVWVADPCSDGEFSCTFWLKALVTYAKESFKVFGRAKTAENRPKSHLRGNECFQLVLYVRIDSANLSVTLFLITFCWGGESDLSPQLFGVGYQGFNVTRHDKLRIAIGTYPNVTPCSPPQ